MDDIRIFKFPLEKGRVCYYATSETREDVRFNCVATVVSPKGIEVKTRFEEGKRHPLYNGVIETSWLEFLIVTGYSKGEMTVGL